MRSITLFGIFILSSWLQVAAAQVPFTKGVNLTSWFQTNGARQIQFSKYTLQDIQNIKSLGCDVIRLPINLHVMTSRENPETLDPLFFEFLDQVVNWCEQEEMHLILDNHSFDPAKSTDPAVEETLLNVWRQMAKHFKNRSHLIYYEILNEPHGIERSVWGRIQGNVIEIIREEDQKHTIIVGGADWNSFRSLSDLPYYEDQNLIYTFHFYEPFLFTHQGASWTNPSMEPLADVPFPFQASEMPEVPASLQDTWIASAMTEYSEKGLLDTVKKQMDMAIAFKNARKVPVFCGEFGVYKPNSDPVERVYWYQEVSKYLTENGIAWTIWDYQGGFGLFEKNTNQLFDYDLNVPLLESLEFNVPEQKDFVLTPEKTGFKIYSDFIGPNISESSYGGNIDYYNDQFPNNGQYCIKWNDAAQYQNVGFEFIPNKDLSQLVNKDYAIDLLIRSDAPQGSKIDIRFLDSNTDEPGDRPWRMRYTVDDNLVMWDGKWHHLHLKLADFIEQGAWENNTWYNPEGKFDWSAIDRLEIVAEHHNLQDISFWFDNIYITNQDTASILESSVVTDLNTSIIESFKVFPNPVREKVHFSMEILRPGQIKLEIFDLSGSRVQAIERTLQHAGKHQIHLDKKLSAGMYLCKFSTINQIFNEKIWVSE